jgi:hypothetical protein
MRPRASPTCAQTWDHARREERVAWPEREALRANLDQKLALDDIEPLVLLIVQVSGRAAPGVEGVLKDEQAAAVLGRHLEVDGADAEAAPLAEAVCSGGDEGGHRLAH